MGNLKWLLIGVLVLLGAYFVVRSQQSGYATQADRIFPEETDSVHKISFEKGPDTLTLEKKDGNWTIVGHDTLQVREERISTLLDQAFRVKRETLMTQKVDNWGKYSVDDSTGTHVRVYDASGKLLAHAVFGRSSSDWARNYVRTGDAPEVYLTDQNVLYQANPSPTYWGEKPQPDSTAAEPTPALGTP